MTAVERNNIVKDVLDAITEQGEFYLGFAYDPMTQLGRCNCVNTGFLRVPTLKVTHKPKKTVLDFRMHHGQTGRVEVGVSPTFSDELRMKVQKELSKHQKDWD